MGDTERTLDDYLDLLLERIRAHPVYGPNMRDAAERQDELVLDYHTHGPDHGYCVAIRRRTLTLPLLRQTAPLEELVHVQGVGRREDECVPLMSTLGRKLVDAYELEHAPVIHLNGEPLGT